MPQCLCAWPTRVLGCSRLSPVSPKVLCWRGFSARAAHAAAHQSRRCRRAIEGCHLGGRARLPPGGHCLYTKQARGLSWESPKHILLCAFQPSMLAVIEILGLSTSISRITSGVEASARGLLYAAWRSGPALSVGDDTGDLSSVSLSVGPSLQAPLERQCRSGVPVSFLAVR